MDTGFADRVRTARRTRDLTLEELAGRSGVSRAALSKIERGERNPSLSYALQIAEALQTPLAELVGQTPRPVTVVRHGKAPRVIDQASRAVRESLLEPRPGAELVRYTLPPRAALDPFPQHESGTREAFVVLAGRVAVTSGDTTVDLAADDAATLPGDRDHQISNPGDTEASLLLLIIRPR
ncbi:MAG: helix-turn-helix domain-containing protein [Streptosporangiaceae bacterium]